MARAVAPTVAIEVIPTGKMRDTVAVSLQLNGGSYDNLTYAWSDDSGRGPQGAFDHPNNANPTYTRPDVNRDRDLTVTCVVTAHGTGTNADANTSDTSRDIEITSVMHVDAADVPSVEVLIIHNGYERKPVTLMVNVGGSHAGNYDTLTYRWQVFGYAANNYDRDVTGDSMNDATLRNPIWTRPGVTGDTRVIVRCTLTATGTNGKALRGTTESTYHQFATTILDFPDARGPNFTDIQTTTVNPASSTFRESDWHHGLVSALEGTQVWIRPIFNSGTYDEASIDYFQKARSASTWNAIVRKVNPDYQRTTWTMPQVTADTQYHIRGEFNVKGLDVNAEINTTAQSSVQSEYGTVRNHPNPQAPSLEVSHYENNRHDVIEGIPEGLEGTSVELTVVEFGEQYDSLSYLWTATGTDGTNFNSSLSGTSGSVTGIRTTRDIMFTRPQTDHDRSIDVRCTVTAHGNNVKANDDVNSTSSDTARTIVRDHHPADVPSIGIQSVTNGLPHRAIQLVPIIGSTHAGTYDTLTYNWQIWDRNHEGDPDHERTNTIDNHTARSPIWTRPYIDNNSHQITVRCTLTAHGNDTNAAAGTSESTHVDFYTTITQLPDVVAPTSVVLAAIPNGTEGTVFTASATVNGGSYDTDDYFWYGYEGTTPPSNIPLLKVSLHPSVGFIRAPVSADNTAFTYYVEAEVNGEGTNHKAHQVHRVQSNSVVTHVNVAPPEPPTPPPETVVITDGDGNNIAGPFHVVFVDENNTGIDVEDQA